VNNRIVNFAVKKSVSFVMKTISCILGCFLICLFVVSMMGMEGCEGGRTTDPKPVSFVSVDPASTGTIQSNQLITVTFDGSPAFVNVSEGITTLNGNTLTIAGPFKPGELNLVLDWPDGIVSLIYTIQSPPVVKDPPKEIIQDVWVDYDTWENGQKGMRIHVKFTLSTQKNSQCSVTMCFEFRVFGVRLLDWRPLIDVNGKYATADGKVAVAKDFVHDSIETTYDDFNIFMPYSELHPDEIKVEAEEADAVSNAIDDDLVILHPRLRCIIKIENRTLGTLLDSSNVTFKYSHPIPFLNVEETAWGTD
jgi:hypothetical protein